MFNNYRYFIVLAEECNITRAAERLFITHQNLSRYLAKLESDFGIALFHRKPVFSLTHAGQLMLNALKEIEQTEANLRAQFVNLRRDSTGVIRLGTTEGRFRILMPDVISAFKRDYPDVQLLINSAASPTLRSMVLSNQLDLIIAGIPPEDSSQMEHITTIQERLYLVISDNMLRQAFGSNFPDCKKSLAQGADLKLFQTIPFAMNLPHLNSHIMLNKHLSKLGITLNCIHISSHPDLHHMMSARDFAASFCLTMYLPSLFKLNASLPENDKLNIFPIKGLDETNPVAICYMKNRIFPHYTRALIRMLREQCQTFAKNDDMIHTYNVT